jgi:hypothetical protein
MKPVSDNTPTFFQLNEGQINKIAEWRGYSPATVKKLSQRGMIGMTDNNRIAFKTAGGIHYRMKPDGEEVSWRYSPGAKPSIFTVGDVEGGGTITCFESPWDSIAFYDSSGEPAIASRGASNARLITDYLQEHNIKEAVVSPQNDEAGQEWAQAVIAGCNGTALKLMTVPVEHDDLNEWRQAGATDGQIFNAFIDAKPVAEAEVSKLSDIGMLPIIYLEKPFFQKDAFHLLGGRKNAGKGVFLTNVAARVTRGELGDKRGVLWVAAGEDSYNMDVHPRMVAAGGDATKVIIPKVHINLPEGVGKLRTWVKSFDIGLVVLDPISGMIGGEVNTNHGGEIRECICPLNNLAHEGGCLVVGVRHLTKSAEEGDALSRVLGSIEWVNVPRMVLMLAHDREEEDVRHIQVKAGNRLKGGTPSKRFRIIGVPGIVKGGEPIAKAVFLEGEGEDVGELLKQTEPPSTKKGKAQMCMLDLLEKAQDLGETLEAKQLTADVMKMAGASYPTVRDVKTELKKQGLIAFVPDRKGDGEIKHWRVKRTDLPRPDDLSGDTAAGAAK